MKSLFFILLMISWASNILAQDSSIYFEKLYDYHKSADGAWSMVANNDGSYVAVGSSLSPQTFDITLLFLKFDRFGDLIIKKAFYKPGYQFYTGVPNTLVKTHDGGFAFGGSVKETNTNLSDALLVKFNAAGDTEFTKMYGDTAFDYFADCIETFDHGFILAGQTYNFGAAPNGDGYVVKTDSTGNLQWQKTYGTEAYDLFFSVIQMPDSGYIFGGDRNLGGIDFGAWLVRTDKAGILEREKVFDQGAYRCGGAAFTAGLDNKLLMYGCLDTTITTGDYKYPRYVAKLDTGFNIIWRVIFNDPIENGIINQRQFEDSSITAVGFQGDEVTGAANGLVAKITSGGVLKWKREYYYRQLWNGAPLFNYFYDVQQAPDKGYVMCGFTQDSSKIPNQDIWLVKLDSNGCLQPGCDTVATGIIEVSDVKSELKIYPNPAKDYVAILYNIPSAAKDAILQFIDLTGQIIEQIPMDAHEHYIKLDVSRLKGGILICDLLVNGEKVSSKKLVVIH